MYKEKLINQKIKELKRKILHERNSNIREIYKDSIKYLQLKVS